MTTATKRAPVRTLVDILADPEKAAGLPKTAIPQLRGELARLDTLLLSRLLEDINEKGDEDGDQLLSVPEAAARLGLSPDYLYHHAKRLPFTRRIGRKLLFSAQGIQRYITKQRT